MRTSIIRALSAISTIAILAACAGSTGSSARSQAAAAPVADITSAPIPAPTVEQSATANAVATTRPIQEVGRPGILAPGTYRYSQRDPAVAFTVPTGWIMTEAMPLHFGLRPTEFDADNTVKVWYDMRVASRDPSCPEEPDPELGHSADEFTFAIRRLPGVLPTQATPIALGGLDGRRFDLQIKETWTEPCPFTDGVPSRTLFTDDLVPDDPAFWGLSGYDERMRLIVLDDGAGSNVVITVDAVDPSSFDALVAAAMPVIETFRFDAPTAQPAAGAAADGLAFAVEAPPVGPRLDVPIGASKNVTVTYGARLAVVGAACDGALDPAAGPDASSILATLQARRGWIVGAPTPVTLGAASGWWFDLRRPDDLVCPDGGINIPLFVSDLDQAAADLPSVHIDPGYASRVFLLDDGRGGSIVIDINAHRSFQQATLVERAMPIVLGIQPLIDSFRFTLGP